MKDIDPRLLPELLFCNAEAGLLFWRPRSKEWFKDGKESTASAWNTKWAGARAFTAVLRSGEGYHVGAILGRNYRASRVIWAMHYGEWPKFHVDHINGKSTDDRISNLRDVPNWENHRNEKRSKNNTSGFNGVVWDKQTSMWRAIIKVGYRNIHLGRFGSIEEAIQARNAANVLHGFTTRHGLPLSSDRAAR